MIFNRQDIAKELNIKIAMNDEMANAINLWSNMYADTPPWLDDKTKTMGLPGAIANELARLVTVEFKSEINNNDILNSAYQNLLNVLRVNTEYACAKGGLIFKPYIVDDHIEIDIVQQDNFLPVSYNSTGEITSAVFLESKVVEDKKYTRLEYHDFNDNIYTIKNNVYVKNNVISTDKSLGQKTVLNCIPEWEELESEAFIETATRPFFSYFKIPQANKIDFNSPLGVSTFSKAVNLIMEADKQYSRILWEYEAKETAIHASENLFKLDGKGGYKLPRGKERLFKLFTWEEKKGENLLEVFSPDIRDSSLFNGLNNILRKIEFNCGLAYGTLSDVNDIAKTATEIKTSKQRSYSTVKDIQKALEEALKDLILSMIDLANLYDLKINNLDIDKDVSFAWDDSIVLDREAELESMRNDVAAGILKAEIYIAKKYGVSEEEALEMMPKGEESLKSYSPVDKLEE